MHADPKSAKRLMAWLYFGGMLDGDFSNTTYLFNTDSSYPVWTPGVNFINVLSIAFSYNFYVRKSQKCKNDSRLIGHFELSGYSRVKLSCT